MVHNLPDTLLGDTKHLSQSCYRLTFFVAGANVSIARAFGERAIGDGGLREF